MKLRPPLSLRYVARSAWLVALLATVAVARPLLRAARAARARRRGGARAPAAGCAAKCDGKCD